MYINVNSVNNVNIQPDNHKVLILLGSITKRQSFLMTSLTQMIILDRLLNTLEFKPFTKQQSFKDYSHPNDHTRETTGHTVPLPVQTMHLLNNRQAIDTPGFKPFTAIIIQFLLTKSGLK